MNRTYLSCLITVIAFLYSCNPKTNNQECPPYRTSEILAAHDIAVTNTESGRVAGFIEDGVYIYKGIPYAQAERFMPPVAPAKWEGVRSSRAYGPTCPQEYRSGWDVDEAAFECDWDDGNPSEDCMRINIWTQGINDGKKRPVMVWLHGGGFSGGSSQDMPAYDGANLAKRGDVVVVSLNHRLNVLGFLDLSVFGEKYAKSGNVGLLDLVAGLNWVKNNIASFGGDPGNVTIFGQSGGGGKVSTLLATPSAKELFHKAIVQSGSIFRGTERSLSCRIGAAVVEELGLKASQIDSLQRIPYHRLLSASNKAIARVRKETQTSIRFGFGPIIDGIVLPSHPFSPTAPEMSKDIPMMIGTTIHEFTRSNRNLEMKKMTMKDAVALLEQQYGERTGEFVEAFKKVYPKFKPVDLLDVDFIFRPGAIQQATLKYAQGGAPVYMYFFEWESPILDNGARSSHCMEINFVFDNIYRARYMTGGAPDAYRLAEKMSSSWANFARTGDPNAKGLPHWEPFTPEKGATMIFNNDCEIRYNHDCELINVVNSIRGFPN